MCIQLASSAGRAIAASFAQTFIFGSRLSHKAPVLDPLAPVVALASLALLSAVSALASTRVCPRLLSPAFLTLDEEGGAGLTVVAGRRLRSFWRLDPASAPAASSSICLAIISFVLCGRNLRSLLGDGWPLVRLLKRPVSRLSAEDFPSLLRVSFSVTHSHLVCLVPMVIVLWLPAAKVSF